MGNINYEESETFYYKFKRILRQAFLWTASAAAVGLTYGLIKGNVIQNINRFIYVVAMLLLAYTIIPVEELRTFGDKTKAVSIKEVEELRRGKRRRMNQQLWNFLMTGIVFTVAIVMELIRFRILGGK